MSIYDNEILTHSLELIFQTVCKFLVIYVLYMLRYLSKCRVAV